MSLDENQIVNDGRILGYSVVGKPSASTPTLQFNATNNTFEWVAGGGGGMGDLEFIQSKVDSGDYFQVSGDIDNFGDTIEYIVPNGKTAYLISAKITMKANPTLSVSLPGSGSVNDQTVADLKIDSNVKDKATIGIWASYAGSTGSTPGAGLGFGKSPPGKFDVLGLSLVGDGVKKIEIENIADSGSAFATMAGYLKDT